MASQIASKFNLDLRAPVFAGVRKGSWWLRVITMVLVDATLLGFAWRVAETFSTRVDFSWNTDNSLVSLLPIVFIEIGLIAFQGLYEGGEKRSDYLSILKTLTFAHAILLIIAFFYQPGSWFSTSKFILSWLLSIFFICAGRLAVNTTIQYLRTQGMFRHSVFIISDLEEQKENISTLLKKENRYSIVGYADARSLDRRRRRATLEKINSLGVTEVFVSWDVLKNRMFVCWLFQAAGVTLHIIPGDLKPIHRQIELTRIGGMPYISFSCPLITGRDFWIKRSFDFCFAALFLLLTSPLYLCIALLIKLDSPGPVIYKQKRIGLKGRPFQVWKFRTMKANAEQLQKELEALNEMKDGVLFKIKDDPRVTRVGKFLRRYSLDELPQIFNVLFGEMSIVGPRPLPVRDTEKFVERHFIRHEVLPGITGLWQVSGRSDIVDFEQVIRLDLTYIENWSFRLDLQILLQTVKVVLKKQGAY